MIARAEINRRGRWSVLVNGTIQTNHNEEKEAYESAVFFKYCYPFEAVTIVPPVMDIELKDTKCPELLVGAEPPKLIIKGKDEILQ